MWLCNSSLTPLPKMWGGSLAFYLLGKPGLDKQNARPDPKASVIYEPGFNDK